MDRKHSSIGLLSKVLSSLRPLALFRIKKVAANKHRVPIYCFGSTRQRFQAVEWLFSGSKFQTSNRDFVIKVSQEIFSASQLKGNAIAQRNAYHKLVSASRSLLKFLR
jgi:ribosomal protein S7